MSETSPSFPQPAVVLHGVDKAFRNGDQVTSVLRKADFTARAGGMTFLVGPSGCGKTTLLSVLCGTLATDAGEVRVLGQDLHRMSGAALTRFRALHVGFIFQQFNLIPTLTVAENVAIPLRIQGVASGTAILKARRMLEEVDLADKGDERPFRLSGGQQQRVAIARALVHRPDLVVCDEPTSALDSLTGQRVLELLRNASGTGGRTVIVVTHDPRIYRHADSMAEMEDGRIQRVLETPSAIAAAHPVT
jgi:putative ABC transport system ATP-binding protein